jgi:hypothetical protein
MRHAQHPRIFLSYRHAEHGQGADAAARNSAHVAWVHQFARDLAACRVEPVLDARIRQIAGQLFDTDPETEPAIANIALASIHVCHAFLPIITPGWVERIGYADFSAQSSWQDGYVLDEWQQAAASARAGRIEILPIFRAGAIERSLDLPLVRGAGIVFDFTDDADYEHNIELLADYLHRSRRISQPAIDMTLGDWIIEFLRELQQQDQGDSS